MQTSPNFNVNAPADSSQGIYGLPGNYQNSQVIFLPLPWEVTTSYGGGTAHGPSAIIEASVQLDLYDLDVVDPYDHGLYCLPIDPRVSEWNARGRVHAQKIIDGLGETNDDPELISALAKTNELSENLNHFVFQETSKILSDKKIPALIGGDHSCPLGAFKAAAAQYPNFGILHFDAHSDTRNAYMGFKNSHASIMHNAATQIPEITKFVQVGIRDFCEDEVNFTRAQGDRFHVFLDQTLSDLKLHGQTFQKIAEMILKPLPECVWVSFDIDGLDPRFCPHTGTPVPGGLDYSEATYLLRMLAQSGRKIIGFDVVEVAPPCDESGAPLVPVQAIDEWDANVGMRLIYKLAALSLASQKKSDFRSL